jgi:hypothetical protein
MRTLMNTHSHQSTGFITANGLQDRWQVSGMTLWRLRRKGTLTAYKIGKGVRFSIAEVEKIEREAATSAAATGSPIKSNSAA